MNPQERKVIETHFSQIVKELNVASQAYNAPKLKVTMLLSGTDCNTGKPFAHIVMLNGDNEYLRDFFNQYAAKLASDRIALEDQLSKTEMGE